MSGFKRVASYARVSSQRQANDNTIQSQREAIIARIGRDGFQLDCDFEFCDEGYSGSVLRRPALEALRDQVFSSLIDRVYILAPDRLARRLAHQAILLEEFEKSQCEIVFLNQEGLPDSPESNLLIQMQGMIAEYEREKILERTRRGRRYAAAAGRVSVFGRAPYGYRYISKHEGGGQARWEIDPVKSETVRFMFEQVAKYRVTLSGVCRALKTREIMSPKGKSTWNTSTVLGILTNPAYTGQAKYGKERLAPRKPGRRAKRGDPKIPRQAKVSVATSPQEQITIAVPLIVNQSIFEAVGKRMEENKKRQRQWLVNSKYLLSGMLICGQCDSAYCGRKPRGYFYYRCIGTERNRVRNKAICTNGSVLGDELESNVWCEVSKLLRDPGRLAEELQRRQEPSQSKGDLANLECRVKKLRGRLDRLIDAYTDGLMNKSEFQSRITSARNLHDREQAALTSLRGEFIEVDLAKATETLEQLAVQARARLDSASEGLKRTLIELLIKQIEIYPQEVRIVYKVPSHPFDLGHEGGHFLQHCSPRQRLAGG